MRVLSMALVPAMLICAPVIAQTAGVRPAASAAQALVETDSEFNASQARAVILALATALEENFVDPRVGRAYSAELRSKLVAGQYDDFSGKDAFAESVTADLQAVQSDGHLRLFAPVKPGAKPKYRLAPSADGAIGKHGWIADGVAYVELTIFPGDPATVAKLRSILDGFASAKTLLIDVRGHHGGDLAEVDVLASYLFPSQIELARMDTREAAERAGLNAFNDGPTLLRVDGPQGVVRRSHIAVPNAAASALRNAQVLVLTSKKTVSAAEHLAMVLQRTQRATIVGETTYGAGHYGDPYPLPGGFKVFIPSGRSFDPDTGKGWEGTGITPDISVPADKGLDEALRLAGVSVGAEAALASLK